MLSLFPSGLITTTSRKLDREQQDEHILEVRAPLFHASSLNIKLAVKLFTSFPARPLRQLKNMSGIHKKGHFAKSCPCSDFRMGRLEKWEVCGRSRRPSLCSFPPFHLADASSRDRRASPPATVSTPGFTLSRAAFALRRPEADNSSFSCVSGADGQRIRCLLIIIRTHTVHLSAVPEHEGS